MPRTKYEPFTWIEEEVALFLLGGRVLGNGEACSTSRAVVIVHRNLDVRASKVGIC